MKALWSPEDKKILKECYADPDGLTFIAEITGKTYQQIVGEANRLGLHRQKRHYNTKGMSKYFRNPEPLPGGLKTGKCPGKFNGPCGKRLWFETVHDKNGFSTELFDLVCEAGHRFQIP